MTFPLLCLSNTNFVLSLDYIYLNIFSDLLNIYFQICFLWESVLFLRPPLPEYVWIMRFSCECDRHPLFQEGVRGVLEGLASRYADEFSTHYQDVFDHLDNLRMEAWNQLVNRIKTPQVTEDDPSGAQPQPPSPARSLQHEPLQHQQQQHDDDDQADGAGSSSSQARQHSSSQTSSHSSSPEHRPYDDQPIYVPGRYNVSTTIATTHSSSVVVETALWLRGQCIVQIFVFIFLSLFLFT